MCPHPPLLVPAVATGAAGELDEIRSACEQAVRSLVEVGPEWIVVVGDGPGRIDLDDGAWGTLTGYGVALDAGGPDRSIPAVLPLAQTIGAWLLDEAGWTGRRRYLAVPATTSAADAARLGADLDRRDTRIALLVMGDGSARRSTAAPGYLDDRAEPFDTAAVEGMGAADPTALLDLDPELGRTLLAAGRAPWQVLAGAIAAGDTRTWKGRVLTHSAPYGVGYVVATLSCRP